jgi:hypothetical protein
MDPRIIVFLCVASVVVAVESRGKLTFFFLSKTQGWSTVYVGYAWRTSYANYARNICVTYAPDSRRMRVTSANLKQMLRAPVAQQGMLLLDPSCSIT